RLDPHAAGSGHRREEQPFAAEQRRLDAADEFDVVLYRRIERREAAGVDAQLLARLELHRNNRAAAVNEHVAGAFEPLKDEPFAAKEAGAEAFGELDVDVDLSGGAQERIALAQDRGVEQ